MAEALTGKRLEILEFIGDSLREQGYPPSVREIGEAVGLTSSSTVHAHLAVLQREGYLRRDPTKPRAMEVRFDPSSRAAMAASPVRHVPLLGDVAAGTGVLASENVEELLPLPEDFTGSGSVFMLRVRGESMIDAGIFDGDYVVVRQQPDADNGDIVVAGIPGDEATVKTFARRRGKVVLTPANAVALPHGVRPRRRDDLRAGRHRPAPTLSRVPAETPGASVSRTGRSVTVSAASSTVARTSRARSSSRARHVLVGGVGEQGVAGTEVGGRHTDLGEGGHVGPPHLGPRRRPGGGHQ